MPLPTDDPGPAAIKRALRRSMISRILALSPETREPEERALERRFAELPGYAAAQTVLLYVTAFPEELRTASYFERSYALGKRVLCPRVDRASRSLRLFVVERPQDDLVPGTLDIPEPRAGLPEVDPSEVDWVLVPGLAFDERGYRVGRGAGHYDRLLPRLRPDAGRWALCLNCQLVPPLPAEPHDAPLHGTVTPNRVVWGVEWPGGPLA